MAMELTHKWVQESSWGERCIVHKAEILSAICELIVNKIRQPKFLTAILASTASYKETLHLPKYPM
jgi:hypothetical protein